MHVSEVRRPVPRPEGRLVRKEDALTRHGASSAKIAHARSERAHELAQSGSQGRAMVVKRAQEKAIAQDGRRGTSD
eukprot:6178623-Pleurochrysis_carterae.AAC.1